MTYSILARCARTGRFGLGVASYSIAVGLYCEAAVRPNTGVTFTQGAFLHSNNRLALNLVAQGFTARQALSEVIANDPKADFRHIGLIDRDGAAVAHCGSRLAESSSHRAGDGYIVLGDRVTAGVLDAIAAAFEDTGSLDLEERLLRALESGRDAGGIMGSRGSLPERSVALIVFGNHDFSDVDLRVDMHAAAVDELRRLYTEYTPHAAYYLQRALSPRNAPTSMEFADILKSQGNTS